jgi:hypothetical protein
MAFFMFLAGVAGPAVVTADPPGGVTAEVPGLIVRSGDEPAIYAFPPAGFDANRPAGYWPYRYPPYPFPHPAFQSFPAYPLYGAPVPYVPLGSSYPAPAPEVRSIEFKPGGRLVIEAEPEDAAVYVDAMRLDNRSEHGYEIGVLAGVHSVDVRKTGMRPWSGTVDVPPGGGLLVSVALEPGVTPGPAKQADDEPAN